MRDGVICGATVLLVAIAAIAAGTYLIPRVMREPARYGNLSQAVQALAVIVFGASSLSVAFGVFTLRQNAGRDAALDRAATLITRIHETSVNEARLLEADDATLGNRALDCIIYLKYRLLYTPHWTATRLHHHSDLMDPQELGRRPHGSDLSEAEPSKRALVSGQFDKCIGHDETAQNEVQNDGDEPQIRKRGVKIQRIISTRLASDEMALLEWPDLPTQARELTETTVSADLCASPSRKEDVFDLFEGLRASAGRKDEARVFAQAFLTEYPHLDIFLRSVCEKKFKDTVAASSAGTRSSLERYAKVAAPRP
jgi:hypothetical protein